MSVDFFWRRVAGPTVAQATPDELDELVPHWFDDAFAPLAQAGLVLGVERHGYLLDVVLTGGGTRSGEACRLPVFGGEPRTTTVAEDAECGAELLVLGPAEVRDAAAFLRDLPVRETVDGLAPTLAREAAAVGFGTPWDAEWAGAVSEDLLALRTFFLAAAEADDGVVKFELA